MHPLPSPLWHGSVGYWDEIICLVPTLILIGLAVYVAMVERRKRQRSDSGDPQPDEERPVSERP